MSKSKKRIDILVEEWQNVGEPDQEAFPWSRSRAKWQELADDFGIDISDFPDLIDRGYLWWLNSTGTPVERVFLAVMIWGYGDIGYGPHRVRQMFNSPNFIDSLCKVRASCEKSQFLEAYAILKNSKIRQLGPAFGTKVLAFFHQKNGAPPILDSVVAKWCNRHAAKELGPSGLNAEVWNLETYERYITWIYSVSQAKRVAMCSLEQLMFEDEYSSN